MTKKHFIAFADFIKTRPDLCFTLRQLIGLAEFCRGQNFRFKSNRWLGYIAGTNGPSGGRIKTR